MSDLPSIRRKSITDPRGPWKVIVEQNCGIDSVFPSRQWTMVSLYTRRCLLPGSGFITKLLFLTILKYIHSTLVIFWCFRFAPGRSKSPLRDLIVVTVIVLVIVFLPSINSPLQFILPANCVRTNMCHPCIYMQRKKHLRRVHFKWPTGCLFYLCPIS